jgi:hypothetical protein
MSPFRGTFRTFTPKGHIPHTTYARIARRANLPHASALVLSGKSQPSSGASRLNEEGRFGRSSRYVGRGCDGRGWHVRRAWRMRTAKSRGPGAPGLAPSLRIGDVGPSGSTRREPQATVTKTSWTPGRSRISRKTIARGMPGDPAEPVVTAACFFCCRWAMGEAITRHSPRPLRSLRANLSASLGRGVSRDRIVVSELLRVGMSGRPVHERKGLLM